MFYPPVTSLYSLQHSLIVWCVNYRLLQPSRSRGLYLVRTAHITSPECVCGCVVVAPRLPDHLATTLLPCFRPALISRRETRGSAIRVILLLSRFVCNDLPSEWLSARSINNSSQPSKWLWRKSDMGKKS